MPLLEPMRAFSGRMRNYYSGSRFAYIRLNGARAAACGQSSRALHAEFYELFAILAVPSEVIGLHGHRAEPPADVLYLRFSIRLWMPLGALARRRRSFQAVFLVLVFSGLTLMEELDRSESAMSISPQALSVHPSYIRCMVFLLFVGDKSSPPRRLL